MATYCIICGNKRNGIPIRNDYVLEVMRWFKRNVTKDEKGNRLVVCKECYPKYKKNMDRFNSRQAIYMVLAGLFFIFTILTAPILQAVSLSIMVFIALYLLSLLNYTPGLQITEKKPNH